MTEKNNKIYEFGEFRLDVAEQILQCNGENMTLTPKIFDLLVILVENHGHLLTKDELIKKLWAESFVEEANLNVTVSALRRALGEKPNENRFIETVPRRGYRFVAQAREVSEQKSFEIEKSISEADTISFELSTKRCPKCRTVYTDEMLNFCLNDGEILNSVSNNAGLTTQKLKPQISFFSKKSIISIGAVLLLILGAAFVWKFAFQPAKIEVSNIKTIAVLPFKPLANNQTDNALEIGMADALITKLSSLQQITVRPTNAVTKYAATNTDALTAGHELQVEAVLDGKIQRADNKIRVTVQLLRVSDGATLWAGSFDDFFTNIFAVQDSISEKKTASLSLKISGAEQKQLAKRYTENTEAYELYLQGNFHRRKGIPDDIVKSLNYYKLAIEKDQNYVLPYAAMALACIDLSNYGVEVSKNGEIARRMAERAMELDINSAEANLALGMTKYGLDLNIKESEKYIERAIELNPGSAEAVLQKADYLSNTGKLGEALQTIEKARQLDPLSVWINTTYVDILVNLHRYDEALEYGKKLTTENPTSVHYRRTLARVYAIKGMYKEAIEQHLQDVELGGMRKAAASLGYIYAKAGRTKEANEILQDRIAHVGEPSVPNYGIALIYAGLGNKDKSLEWLEKSYQAKEPTILIIKSMPEWEIIRSDPRYFDLAKRLGLEN